MGRTLHAEYFIIFLLVIPLQAVPGREEEIFRDDFNDSLDVLKWNAANKRSQVNSELETYRPDAIFVKGGNLIIQSDNVSPEEYTSGRVDTQNKFSFLYGEIEWRARFPRGQGIWPALWLAHPKCDAAVPCDNYWPPAVIASEIRGDQPRQPISTLYYRNTGGSGSFPGNSYSSPVDLSDDFHLYRIKWTRKLVVIHIDNTELLRVEDPEKIPQIALQIVMDVAVGGAFPGAPTNTTHFPTQFLIDYVVVRKVQEEPVHTPAYVAPVVGTLGSLLLLAAFAVFLFLLCKRRNLRVGNMRSKTATGNWDGWMGHSLAYAKTGNASYDKLLQRYVCLIEIPADHLKLSEDVLGKGEFGIVYKGVARGLRGLPKATTVAVKMLIQTPLDDDQQRQLAEEIRMMTKVGRHLNVVNLLGIVMKGNPLLVLEYCPYGSLLTYLKIHRGAYFYDHVDKYGKLLPFDVLEETKLLAEAKQFALASRRSSFPAVNFDALIMSTKDLLSFAFQISRGMEYLVSRSIIHRDLAARNVLVAEDKVVKISDFGMARQRQSVYVLESSQASLPVKWMPPEAIVTKTFSQKSDVWSYGILLWEVFSLGEIPYIGSGASGFLNEFVTWLAEGHQMDRPSAAPLEIDAIMRRCWKLHAADRPTFTELRETMDELVSADRSDDYLTLDEPYLCFNKLNQDLLEKMLLVQDDHREVKNPSPAHGVRETFIDS